MISKISQTEASIVTDRFSGRPTVEITKLAGMVGKKQIKLYLVGDEELERLPLKFQPSVEIEIYATAQMNYLSITSCNKIFAPLLIKDKVMFVFKDSSIIELSFTASRLVENKSVTNFLLLPDLQLLYMFQNMIDHILIYNHKGNMYFKYDFFEDGNEQYQNKEEGEMLFQIIVEFIVEGKKALLNI
jgi:hypothetical protein